MLIRRKRWMFICIYAMIQFVFNRYNDWEIKFGKACSVSLKKLTHFFLPDVFIPMPENLLVNLNENKEVRTVR